MTQTVASPSALAANLAALGKRNADLESRIAAAAARADVVFADTDQGVPSVAIGATPLCSRHRPLDEADRLADRADLVEHAVVVVLGFGAGHHVRRLAERMGRAGVIVVFEPDVGLLRAVLERIDHSAWLQPASVLFITDPGDRGALARKLDGAESIIAQGITFLEHPPSRRRLADASRQFRMLVSELVKATKTTFLTTLMRSVDTVRNLLLNLDHYAAGPGIADLHGVAGGCPGIVVSAGPSLRRNLDLLARAEVRERSVIICAQTTLRPLLAAGVRPHFVTALDYHEISRRFYEDLSPESVGDVTLVAEPKAHPVILDSFPGPVRCCANELLDEILGDAKRPMGVLPAGSTVAHLAVYLAHHLGCNPIVMVGQDLAFTDGLYYTPGTAIEEVWAPELNAFNTIEMMQWQRIARHRVHLSRLRDVKGRMVFSDAQMLAYLQQFERDFAGLREAGVEVIDATEGGIAKQHTTARPLAEVLDRYATRPLPPLPPACPGLDPQRLNAARRRVEAVQRDVVELREISIETAEVLRRMLEDQDDTPKMQRHFRRIESYRRRVEQRMNAFRIISHLNQLGVYKRFRADRRLHMQTDLDPRQRQRAQLQRDLENVTWTADAAAEIGRQLVVSGQVLSGSPVDATPAGTSLLADEPTSPGTAGVARVAALVPVDPDRSGLGVPRSLATPFGGRSVLQATLQRLGESRRLESIILIVPRGFDVGPLIDQQGIGLPVVIERCDGSPYGPEQAAIAAARRWSETCWRGGIAGMSVYDEILCPQVMHAVMVKHALTAALLAGPDWPLISAVAGVDEIVARHLELPEQHNLVFTQAPPGLCGCVVSAGLMKELTLRNRLSTIGGLLVYQPHAPQHDPIARSANVRIEHRVRRSRIRATFDSPPWRQALLEAIEPRLDGPIDAVDIVGALESRERAGGSEPPRHLIVELCTRRRSRGLFDCGWPRGPRPDLTTAVAGRIFGEAAPGTVVTLAGAGDPLLHERFDEIVRLATDAGIAGVHVRTELLADRPILDRLLGCEPDVVSVDLHADCPETYRRMMGLDEYERVLSNLHYMVTHRRRLTDHPPTAALALPWIVPRLQRRVETCEDIDGFFDRWQGNLGCALIEPVPASGDDDLLPAPVPPRVLEDQCRHTRSILSDGTVLDKAGDS